MKWKIAGKRKRDLQRINFSNGKLYLLFFLLHERRRKKSSFSRKKSIRKMIHWRELQCNKVLKHEKEKSRLCSYQCSIIFKSSSRKNLFFLEELKISLEKLPISFIEFYSKIFLRVWYDVKTTNAWSNIIIVSFLFHCALQCFYKEIIVFILNAISCDTTEEELLFSQGKKRRSMRLWESAGKRKKIRIKL